MKIMRKIISSILILFSILVLAITCLFQVNSENRPMRFASTEYDVVTITPFSENETTKHALATTTTETLAGGETVNKNIVNILFKGNKRMSSEAIITYTTVDRSAVEQAGDYKGVSGSVRINRDNYYKLVEIEVNETSFSVNLASDDATTREFAFVITDISYDGIVMVNGDENNRVIHCDLPYLHNLSTSKQSTTDGSYYYFKDYTYDSDFNRRKNYHDVSINRTKTYGDYFGTSEYYTWLSDYVNTGLADVYIGMETYRLYNSWACSAGDVVYTLYRYGDYYNSRLIQLWYDYNRLYHTSTWYNDQIPGNVNSDLTIRDDEYGHDLTKTYDKKGNKYYEFIYVDFKGSRGIDRFHGVKLTDSSKSDNTLEDLKVRLHVNNDESVSTYSVQGTVYIDEILCDTKAPTYVNSYFDGTHAYIDGNVRVSIRFSEPVQVTDENLYANVKILNSNFRFKYESGTGSDTLVFSYPIKNFYGSAINSLSASLYKNATISGFYKSSDTSNHEQSTAVGDFANSIDYNRNRNCNRLATSTFDTTKEVNNVNLNLNAPQVKKETEAVATATPTTSRSIAITVSETQYGTLYYTWSKNKELDIAYKSSFTEEELTEYLNQFDFKKAIKNETGSQSFEILSTDKDGKPLHGSYYLHTFVLSANGRKANTIYGGTNDLAKPYVFDSINPVFDDEVTIGASNTPKSRSYTLTLTDDGQGVAYIVLKYKKAYGTEDEKELWIGTSDDYNSVYDGTNLNITLTPEDLGLTTGEYGFYDFSLVAKDACGNETSFENVAVNQYFDTRDLFDVTFDKTAGNDKFFTTTLNEDVYLLANNQTFTFTNSEDAIVSYSIFNLTYKNKELFKAGVQKVTDEELAKYITYAVSADKKVITLKPLVSGKMVISFDVNGTKQTTDFTYYFTKSLDDEANNYQDDTTNANKILAAEYVKTYVYQLSDNPYTYLEEQAKNGAKTEKYSSTSLPLSFSSQYKAKEYVEYMEKQDMCLVNLTEASSNVITWLNKGGSTEYVKAEGETKTAAVGQYWIRYKSYDWTYSNQKWVYYYYGDSVAYNTINFATVEKKVNLSSALSEVTDYIVSLGEYAYLTNEEYENAYGQLKVNKGQIRPDTLTASKSKSNSTFTTEITYYGDSDIYCSYYRPYEYLNSKVQYTGNEEDAVHFVMQYYIEASSDTHLYYLSTTNFDKSNISSYSSKWVEMENADGTLFDSYFAKNISGKFTIMEIDANGVHVFDVYIDHLAPELNIEYTASNETSELVSEKLNYAYDGETIGASSISFKKFNTNEADPYAFVSIYKVNYTNDLVGSYVIEDLLTTSIYLPDGSYNIVVSDRFGNAYTTTLNLNTTKLTVEITESSDGASFTVSCNREADQIYSYSIYNGNTLITNTYSKSQKIYNSGNYYIKIKDIYGNTYDSTDYYGEVGYKFSKALPEVTWRYYSEGSYIPYKENAENQPMIITEVGSTGDTYYVSTAVSVMFSYSGEYTYEWLSDKPECSVSTSFSGTNVTIDTSSAWKVKIYYDKYPNVYAIYICEVDKTAPTIVAYYENYDYTLADSDYYQQQAVTIGEEGHEITGKSDKFTKIDESDENNSNSYIRSGDVIQTDTFHLSVADDNAVAKIEITLNGKPYNAKLTVLGDGSYTGDFSEYGVYKIVATDIFGNSTNLQFENKEIVKIDHIVDEKNVSDDICYGNTSDVLNISSVGTIVYMVNDNQYIFYIDENGMYRYVIKTSYVTNEENGGQEIGWVTEKSELLYVVSDSSYFEDTWYQVKSASDNIYIKHNSEGYSIKVEVEGEKTLKINYSILLENGTAPVSFASILSGAYSDITLAYADGSEIKTNHDETMILVYDAFSLVSNDSELEDITRIRISYSKTTEFAYYSTIYTTESDRISSYPTNREGFYAIQITNKYGNVLNYYVNYSDSMSVITVATYSDGTTNTYSNDYTSTIYSNESITVNLYSEGGEFTIKKGNEIYNVASEKKGDTLSVTISNTGEFTIEVKDDYGNVKIVKVVIAKATLTYSNDLIFGYNEDALLKSQGYTNTKLSIDYEKLQKLNITAVYIESANGTQIVYDLNSETKITATQESLNEVIGTLGTNDYTVIFRDQYGNKVSKVIHYNEEGTLTVEVNYRSNTIYQKVELGESIDVWSNNSVRITSTSIKSIIAVDGSRTEAPLNLSFSTYDGTGSKDYVVTYHDEYGYIYEINVHLLRQDISISLDSSVTTKLVDEVATTTNNIIVNFPEETTCYYSIDGEGKYPYTKGQEILKDGTYMFTAVDKAGNTNTLIVCKDTSVLYQFTISSSDYPLMNGGAVNGAVEFKATNGDTSYLEIVIKDGEVYQEDKAQSAKFTEAGEYEVLICDAMGNRSYFKFYIITHELASFEYQTPYNYAITDAFITPKGGYIVSFMDSVDSETGFIASTDGSYTITIQSLLTGETYSFNFTIDSTPSPVVMNGVEENGSTTSDVTFTGAQAGDTFIIYRDDKLYKSVTLENSDDAPVINEGGVYKVIVRNAAGVEVEFNFTRAKIMNAAGSSLIMIVCGIFILSLFAGLLFRKRSRIDK